MHKFLQKFSKVMTFTLIATSLIIMLFPTSLVAEATTINLGSVSTFAVLAGSEITNTGPTSIQGTAGGDIGLHPGPGVAITIFPGQTELTTTGEIFLADATAQEAQVDLLVAYNNAIAQTSDETIAADLGGRTLTTGVYTSESSIMLTGVLTLDGGNDPNAVFIFVAGSTLTTISGSQIVLTNGAQACNVYWAIGSSVTLGTNSIFAGTIMAQTSITATTGAQIAGQLLAMNGAVTLDNNSITNDACGNTGSLTVTKNVLGNVSDDEPSSFLITLSGPNDFSDEQLIEAGGSYTWSNLFDGKYTVSEAPLGELWSVEGHGEYDVLSNEETDVLLVNTFTPEGEELPETGSSQSWLALMLLGAGILLVSKKK